MMHYGLGSPKRLQIQSNWKHVSKLDLGRLSKAERERLTTIKTVSLLLSMFLLCMWQRMVNAVALEAAKAHHGQAGQN